ncbi:PilT/PilU family type 4a pilus ATPase [Pseudomonas silvicola]|nr:PilT/PilU family type 4a pilus ATPase [Pseudomonas silvicola]
MEFEKLLRLMVDKSGSDLFITPGLPPSLKVHGRIMPVTRTAMSPEQVREAVLGLMSEAQRVEFTERRECNFAIHARDIGRFRVSAFFQRSLPAMVLRRIESRIPTFDDLKLPETLRGLSMLKRGLILVVGATGTGKSSTLAAMIDHRSKHSTGHIITIEDPIEFLHEHQSCIVTQREVGIDTESFEVALRNTLRQAPDVIMIGEVRSRETMGQALAFAETGHLCVATLHASNADQALERVINFFPMDRHVQVWMELSLNLRAIIAQQLIPSADGTGRRAVVEILVNTPLMAERIRRGEVPGLKTLMSRTNDQGMRTLDQALYELYREKAISYQDALAYADSANDLRLMIKLESSTGTEAREGMHLAPDTGPTPGSR